MEIKLTSVLPVDGSFLYDCVPDILFQYKALLRDCPDAEFVGFQESTTTKVDDRRNKQVDITLTAVFDSGDEQSLKDKNAILHLQKKLERETERKAYMTQWIETNVVREADGVVS